MDNLNMNREFGTKWFTFYTKVRPWLGLFAFLITLADFFQYSYVYMSYWWLTLYFGAAITQAVLNIMVFAKSFGDYKKFVGFVEGVLIFEILDITYAQAVTQYINGAEAPVLILICGILLVAGYFLWYRLNIKYFRKRIIDNDLQYICPRERTKQGRFCSRCGNELVSDNNFCTGCGAEIIKEVEEIRNCFCRKCGAQIKDGNKFCGVCGTEIIETKEVEEI